MNRFDTPRPITVTVNLVLGDLRVIATDRSDTVVSVSPTDGERAADNRAAEQTRVDYLDGRLTVKTPKQGNWSLFGKPGSIDVTVELPAGSRLNADGQVAAVAASGRLGECRISFGVGDIRLDQTGPLRARTYGNFEADQITGHAEITKAQNVRIGALDGNGTVKSANGDCWVGAVTGDLRASTANGSVVVGSAGTGTTLSTANGDLRIDEIAGGTASLKTSHGTIEVGIRPGTAALLDVSTKLGNIHNRMAASDAPAGSEKTADVHAHTQYGDIIIRHA